MNHAPGDGEARSGRRRGRLHTIPMVALAAVLIVVELLIFQSYKETERTTREFSDTTGTTTFLASTQREILVLSRVIRDARRADDAEVEMQRAILERQLGLTSEMAHGTAALDGDLRRLRSLLARFDAATGAAGRQRPTRAMLATLRDAERYTKRIFDTEESRLLESLSNTLHRREATQRLLIILGTAGLVLSLALALYVRRSIRRDFTAAYAELETEVAERKLLQEKLWQQAVHDPVTGLPNRLLFRERLEEAVRAGRRDCAVLFLDLDGFKGVNDALGHDAGDELLVAVGRRLQEHLRPADTLARLGGDEFAVLLEGVSGEAPAREAAGRLLAALRRPFTITGQEISVGASIGVALNAGERAVSAEDLLRDADLAMYVVKRDGKNAVRVFHGAMRDAAEERKRTEEALREAIDKGHIVPFFQPVVDLQAGGVIGAEALVRWCDPERGVLAPAAFLDVAEESGLILPMGLGILRSACEEAARWGTGDTAPWISVNLSPRQLADPELPAHVEHALADAGLAPARLVLEISELAMLDDAQRTTRQLERLRTTGVQLALDDFGTGHSALSYLRFLPLGILKIDRSFIEHVASDDHRSRLTAAMLELGGRIGLPTVAEGIETEEQADALRAMGCVQAQGYHFARPVPAGELAATFARLAPDAPARLPAPAGGGLASAAGGR